jgi:WD40 repeat protein
MARTTEKHNSVVTGLDWKGQVVASCGYDQKVKLWSLKADETNPELKLKLEKDVYIEGFALSNCIFRK